MGSSDEEEMRRVRTARGFKTRLERAEAAGANALQRGASNEAAAAEAEAAAAAALRKAARRAAAQEVIGSSSSEDENAAAPGGQRKTASVAADLNLSNPEIFIQDAPCNSTMSPANRSQRRGIRTQRFLEEATAENSPGTAQHRALQPRVPSSIVSSQLPPGGAAAGSSSDEESLPGPRPLAVPQPSSNESCPHHLDRDSTGSIRSTTGGSRNSTSRTKDTSCSKKYGSISRKKVETSHSESEERTAKSTANAVLSVAAAEVALETADACGNMSTIRWQWKSGRHPFGNTSNSAEADEAESASEEAGERREGIEDENDFLFDQIPEEDQGTTDSVEPSGQAETQPREHTDPQIRSQQPRKSASPLRGGLQEDGREEEEGTHSQSQQEDEGQSTDKENFDLKREKHGRKKILSQKNLVEQDVADCSSSENETEMDEEDYKTEQRRLELGLPSAFGCGAYLGASQGRCASETAYIECFIKEPCDSGSGFGHRCKNENDSKCSAAADGEKDNDEVSKWRSLQLPVSLEVDIPAHSPAQVSAIAVNLRANRMATGGSDGLVRLWDFQGLHLESLRSYRNFCPAEKHKIEALAFSFKHDMLLVAAGDAVCRVYTAQTAELLHTTTRGDMYIRDSACTKGHTHTVLDCCWHPLEAQRFFSCGLDATVRLWDLNAKPYGILQTLPHLACFKTVPSATSASGRAARSSSSDCCTCCAVTPTTADCFVAGCADGSLQLWGSLGSRKVFGRPDAIVRDAHSTSPISASSPAEAAGGAAAASPFGAAAFPGGRQDVTGSQRGTTVDPVRRSGGIAFYSTVATYERATAAAPAAGSLSSAGGPGKASGVAALHFFSDDRRLISRGEDGSVALWDTRNFQQPVTRTSLFCNSVGGRGNLCLSPDEKYVCITTQGKDPVMSGGAVQVLLAEGLSVVTQLPIGPRNITSGHSAGSLAGKAMDRTGSAISEKGTTVKVKGEAQRENVTDAEDNRARNNRAIAKQQVRQPLRILWPQETNQLLVSCTDGSVCVLFDQQMSRKGVLLCVDAAKGSRRRQAAEQEAGMVYTQPYILVPGQLPEGFKETRDGQIIRVKPRGKERVRLFLEKQKTLIPPIPAKEGYAGANVGGGNRSQHLLRQLGLLDPRGKPEQDDDDPVVALRAYAQKVKSSERENQLITRAYAATQPHAVLEFDAEEEEAAIAARVASGVLEESDRLLQQKVRCPRCALRMCQCGYMEEQNVAANAVSSKRQRV